MKRDNFKKLGLERVSKRTKTNSRKRLKFLLEQLDAGKYRGELKVIAKYYVSVFKRLSA